MIKRFLPLIGFALVASLLAFGISYMRNNSMNEVPSPLIGKPAPSFRLPVLNQPERFVSNADLAGKPYLLNVFASWCFACREEHPLLMAEGRSLGMAPLPSTSAYTEHPRASSSMARASSVTSRLDRLRRTCWHSN